MRSFWRTIISRPNSSNPSYPVCAAMAADNSARRQHVLRGQISNESKDRHYSKPSRMHDALAAYRAAVGDRLDPKAALVLDRLSRPYDCWG